MSERRRGLGRGLGALIPTTSATTTADRPTDVFFPRPVELDAAERGAAEPGSADPGRALGPVTGVAGDTGARAGMAPDDRLREVPGASFAELPIDSIRPNPRQPRQVFDEDELEELQQSITQVGVLQPVVVRPLDEQGGAGGAAYELVMGERRWRACQAAGLDLIPAIVRRTGAEDLLRDALLENLHRSQLNPLEEAAAYQQLLEDFGCTHEELAGRIGRSRPQISNTLRLMKLPPLVQRRVASGVLSAGHARALLGLPDGAAMERLAQRIVAEGLSVRAVEEIVLLGEDEPAPRRRARRTPEPQPELEHAAQRLSDRFDTRVSIAMGRRTGRVTVEFATREDLDRILDLMGAAGSD